MCLQRDPDHPIKRGTPNEAPMADIATSDPTLTEYPYAKPDKRPHLDWHAVFAGAVVATAISFVLHTFGAALGFSITSPFPGRGVSGQSVAIAVALWTIWVTASAFMAGGYLTGRIRRRAFNASEHESDVRDAVHGATVWGVGTLLGALVALTVALGAAWVGGNAAANAGDREASMDYAIASLISPTTAITPPASESDRAALRALMARSLMDSNFAEEDRARAAAITARSAGLSEIEARARVDASVQELREAADTARITGVLAAFVLASALLIGAAAACWGAGLGGRHRDGQIILKGWFRHRRI